MKRQAIYLERRAKDRFPLVVKKATELVAKADAKIPAKLDEFIVEAKKKIRSGDLAGAQKILVRIERGEKGLQERPEAPGVGRYSPPGPG